MSRQKILASKMLDGGHSEYDYVLTSLEQSGKLFMETIDGKVMGNSRIILTETK